MSVYICPLCDKAYPEAFTIKSYFERHLKWIHGVYNANFTVNTTSHNDDSNSTVNNDEKPYICTECQTTFSIPSLLETHLHLGHCAKAKTDSDDGSNLTTFNKICGKIECENLRKIRRFKCSYCPKEFISTYKLKMHTYTHTGNRPFKCELCDKTFSNSSNLKLHQPVHSKKRKFKNKQSKKNVSPKKSQVKEKKEPYLCPTCLKSFSRKSLLIKHIRTHTGERPYTCPICQYKFKTAYHLSRHKRTHKRIRPYVCGICQKKFKISYNLTKHLETHKK